MVVLCKLIHLTNMKYQFYHLETLYNLFFETSISTDNDISDCKYMVAKYVIAYPYLMLVLSIPTTIVILVKQSEDCMYEKLTLMCILLLLFAATGK